MINYKNVELSLKKFIGQNPFDHCIVDNFFEIEFAKKLESEIINYEDPRWFSYKNSLEDKKALNDWNIFPKNTYTAFNELLSVKLIGALEKYLGVILYPDHGLHGGGWHIHGVGGNLNPHLDYSIHPKIGLQRKVNIIIYLSSELQPEHGGQLGLWGHNHEDGAPGQLIKVINPLFNRAVIFDTTQNSWHGMSETLKQPLGVYRKSMAVYYLTEPPQDFDTRERALFAPRADQMDDQSIHDLIKLRADSLNYSSVYRGNDKKD